VVPAQRWRPPDAEVAAARLAEAFADLVAALAAETVSREHTTANGHAEVAALDREGAARYLGIGTTKLAQLTRDGRLPSVRIGDRRLWRRADLDSFLAALPSEAER
jgi:excisionase family DNA binding protein